MNYNKLIIPVLILCSFMPLKAQKETEIRNFIRSYPVRKNASLEVVNKYGSVRLTNWDLDSVSIRAEVIAYAPDRSKTEKMFDGVKIDITDYDYTIRARTEFSQSFGMLVESFKGMTSKMISYDSRLEINYYISLPEYLDITVENRYGDVYIEDSKGTVSLTISNGSLKAGTIDKASSLNLSFCDAKIRSIGSGRLDASLSEITINEIKDLTIKSIGSKFEIEKASSLRTDSRRDKFFIGTVDWLYGNSYFTDFRIDNLVRKIEITSKYGNITTEKIEKGFESVNLVSGYSDISLDFDENASYNLDLRHVNAFVSLPDNDENIEKHSLDSEKKEYLIKGHIGGGSDGATVKIDATRGNIYLK